LKRNPWGNFNRRKGIVFLSAITSLLYIHASGAPCAAQTAFKANQPAMITSCGQSPDTFVVKVLCDRMKITVSYDPLIKAESLKDIKTLMIVIGGSAKGLGEAGIDDSMELERVRGVLTKAKDGKIPVVGIHIGGEARRGPLSVKFVELVSPRADYLIVAEDGNKDGYFTKLSKEKKIPLTTIKETLDLGDVLKRMFAVK
jgi:hypothetical protein